MTAPVPTYPPERFSAGDTIRFTRAFSDYPVPDGWAYTLTLIGAVKLEVDGVAAGDLWTVEIPATGADSTETLTPGWYTAVEVVSKGAGALTERYSLTSYPLEVLFNPASVAPGGQLTHAERCVAAIDAVLAGNLTSDVAQYQIEGIAASKREPRDLARLRGIYSGIVARQRYGTVGEAVHFTFGPD